MIAVLWTPKHVAVAVCLPVAAVAAACDSGPGAFETEPIAELIEDVIDDSFDDDDFADFEDCLIDDADDIIEDLFADVDEAAIALDGEYTATAYDTDAGDLYDCGFAEDETDVFVGLYLTEGPRDLERYHERLGAGDDPDLIDVDIDEGDEFRGGQFFEVCVEDDGDALYCEINWLDDNLLVGVYYIGDDSDRVDLDDVAPLFESALPDIIDDLADDDPRDAEVVDLGS